MKPDVVRTIPALRTEVAAWRAAGASIGMVPTMGALHPGHLALVRAAQDENDRVIVTLFVNPTQFAASEDLTAYPRDEDVDRQKLAELGADVLFAPSAAEMYPAGSATAIRPGGAASGLESDFRPGHFAGVATIVAKLLLASLPDRAYFGEKDFQQLLVVKQLVRDLSIPVEIIGCPTVREPDGLALSSRNVYLSAEERERAPRLHAVLNETATQLRGGAKPKAALAAARRALTEAGFSVDYLKLRNAETLAPVTDHAGPQRLLAAARLGKMRLIDNVPV